MPSWDHERSALILRVVYDGPALAGKTTTVRALGHILQRDVVSPAQAEGRTLYFDWMSWVGGRFEGRQIHCEIIAVPGQQALRTRRRLLLRTADVVVSVLDGRDLEAAEAFVRDAIEELRAVDAADVPLVAQVNKRDLPESLPFRDIKERLVEAGAHEVAESVAEQRSGVREMFVRAVGHGLRRARAMIQAGRLPAATREGVTVEELMSLIRAQEEQAEPLVSLEPYRRTRRSTLPPAARAMGVSGAPETTTDLIRLDLDDETRAWCFPEVRALVERELGDTELCVQQVEGGAWLGETGQWLAFAHPADVSVPPDNGAEALRRWRVWHREERHIVSPKRLLFRRPGPDGRETLWQLVRTELSFRYQLMETFQWVTYEEWAALLVDAATRLVDASREMAGLPCTLETLAPLGSSVAYIGLAPPATGNLDGARDWSSGADPVKELLSREIGPLLRELLDAREESRVPTLNELQRATEVGDRRSIVARRLCALLIE